MGCGNACVAIAIMGWLPYKHKINIIVSYGSSFKAIGSPLYIKDEKSACICGSIYASIHVIIDFDFLYY
jgi:hypothetical protein